MANLWLRQLEYDARGYYIALVTGTKLDVHRERVRKSINKLMALGVKRQTIEDLLSDIALEIC